MSWFGRQPLTPERDVQELIRMTEQNERDRICVWLLHRSIILCRDAYAYDKDVSSEARASEALQQAVDDIREGKEP